MRRQPTGTFVLLAVYLVMFVKFQLHEPTEARLIAAGALEPVHLAAGDYWRLVSAAFVHIGLLHLGFNAYFLWVVGPILENELGLERFLILYLVAGIGGNVAGAVLYGPGQIMAGGSTSLFGFMGALVAVILRRGRSYRDFADNHAARSILFLIFVNLAIGFIIPQISNTGHIGGLVAGFGVALFGFSLPDAGGKPRRPHLAHRIAAGLCLAAFTLHACVPFTKTWFWQRALFLTDDTARATVLADGLAARGTKRATIELIEVLRRIQVDGELDPTLGAAWRDGATGLPGYVLGELEAFRLAVNANANDAAGSLPRDPWLPTWQR